MLSPCRHPLYAPARPRPRSSRSPLLLSVSLQSSHSHLTRPPSRPPPVVSRAPRLDLSHLTLSRDASISVRASVPRRSHPQAAQERSLQQEARGRRSRLPGRCVASRFVVLMISLQLTLSRFRFISHSHSFSSARALVRSCPRVPHRVGAASCPFQAPMLESSLTSVPLLPF